MGMVKGFFFNMLKKYLLMTQFFIIFLKANGPMEKLWKGKDLLSNFPPIFMHKIVNTVNMAQLTILELFFYNMKALSLIFNFMVKVCAEEMESKLKDGFRKAIT